MNVFVVYDFTVSVYFSEPVELWIGSLSFYAICILSVMAIFIPSFYMTLGGVNPIFWAVKFLSLNPTRVSLSCVLYGMFCCAVLCCAHVLAIGGGSKKCSIFGIYHPPPSCCKLCIVCYKQLCFYISDSSHNILGRGCLAFFCCRDLEEFVQ